MVNYFELYNIPISFLPDAATVKAKYYELSRRYHPDHYAQANEAVRDEALQMAAWNNNAYKVLSNPDKTMAYILRLNNLLEDEEKYNLPPTFLMEMMDLNELVSDLEMAPDNVHEKQHAITVLTTQLEQWVNEVLPLLVSYDAGKGTEKTLLQIKDYYFRKKYLLRIQERIDRFATH